jgi:mRNA interferase MazF
MVLKMNNLKPRQGEIWLFDPDPVKGNEIGKKIRPGLIFSHNFMNYGPSGLVFIVPLTSINKGIASHVKIEPHIGGVTVTSFALCEQLRSISRDRLIKKLGRINSLAILKEIRSWILDFTRLELDPEI